MLLDAVRGEHPEFGVLVHAEPDILRGRAIPRSGSASGLRERIAASPVDLNHPELPAYATHVLDACAVLAYIEQRVLGVVRDEPEPAMFAGAITETVPVVWRIVPQEVGDRRVE